MERLNYGLAINGAGEFQVANTVHGPGVRDDYSRHLSEPFTYLVATAEYVDKAMGIHCLKGEAYTDARQNRMKGNQSSIRDIILRYHGMQMRRRTPTWSSDFSPDPDTEWEENIVYRNRSLS